MARGTPGSTEDGWFPPGPKNQERKRNHHKMTEAIEKVKRANVRSIKRQK